MYHFHQGLFRNMDKDICYSSVIVMLLQNTMTIIIVTLHRCIIFFKVFFSKTPLTSYIFWVQTYIRVEIHFLIQNLQSGDFGSYPGLGVPHWEFPHWEFPGKSGFWDSQFPGKKFQNSLGKKLIFFKGYFWHFWCYNQVLKLLI